MLSKDGKKKTLSNRIFYTIENLLNKEFFFERTRRYLLT
jgi:hypothetical protein